MCIVSIRQKFSTSVAQHIKVRNIKGPHSIGPIYYTMYCYFTIKVDQYIGNGSGCTQNLRTVMYLRYLRQLMMSIIMVSQQSETFVCLSELRLI